MRPILPMLKESDARRTPRVPADTQALADALRTSISGEVRFDAGSRALYATDGSIKSGERVLLPAVRSASKDTLIIAGGFSCREQIAQTTDRRALHLAEVIQLAMQQDEKGVTKEDAETPSLQPADQALSNVGMALIGCIGPM